jgi:hypothetical protein
VYKCAQRSGRWPGITEGVVKSVLSSIESLGGETAKLVHAGKGDIDADAYLGGHATCVAVPKPEQCQACKSMTPMKCYAKGGETYFFEPQQPVRLGTLFRKECADCHVVHHLHGYKLPAAGKKRRRGEDDGHDRVVMTPYRKELDHPDWEEGSGESVYSSSMFRRWELGLLLNHTSTNVFCQIETQVMKDAAAAGKRGHITPNITWHEC